jgi:hypothetical protein
LVLPTTWVDQLRAPATATAPVLVCGATWRSPGSCAAMASASAWRKGGEPAESRLGPMRWPGRTISRLVPRLLIWSDTARVAPLPTVTIVITAATPMTMPSVVSTERSRLRRISRSASPRVFHHMLRPPPRPLKPPLRWR